MIEFLLSLRNFIVYCVVRHMIAVLEQNANRYDNLDLFTTMYQFSINILLAGYDIFKLNYEKIVSYHVFL